MTRRRASGAMVRRYGPRATKHAARAAAMSRRDTMGPVRDTARMLQLSDSALRERLGPDLVDRDGQVREQGGSQSVAIALPPDKTGFHQHLSSIRAHNQM